MSPRWWLLLLLLLPLAAAADERILSFHADILIRQNGWIDVEETTVVRAEGVAIRRGIYRDYPTDYKDRFGNRVEVDYRPLAVLRNGSPEDFHTEKRANGLRTYFGAADRTVAHGIHTYTYRYAAGRMLGFFEARDELYWNVTGLDSAFPIDRASATVRLDFEIDGADIGVDAFTGVYGATGRDYRASTKSEGIAEFETTQTLHPGEGLSIVVNWPKGLVAAPTGWQRLGWLLSDNRNLLAALGGLLALLTYYVPVWWHFGRDPAPGVIFPRYEPPADFSPASLRYIDNMRYDNTVMTAAVVNLAVKGYLLITESDGVYTLRKTPAGPDRPPLAAGEAALYEGLFRGGSFALLDNSQHELLGAARAAHSKSLKRDYINRYFRTNGAMNLPGILIGIVFATIALGIGDGPSPAVIGVIVAMIVAAIVFAVILKQPTAAGRKLLDDLAGFKEYLEIAEKDEMNLRNPPQKTPQLFEKYLPFALAIGVEQRWAEKFASVLSGIGAGKSAGYRPSWYYGTWNSMDITANTAILSSSLGSSISSSVTPPGSSSGSGGGGFSGGGGGGGGTGGW